MKRPKQPCDINQLDRVIVDLATGNDVYIAKIATGEIEKTGLKQPARRNSGFAGAKE